jgi:ABC-2 type transport system permease protein
MIQNRIDPETAVTIALLNPLQVFRTAALSMFDPQLVVLGPAAYVIIDLFGAKGFWVYALAYPSLLGLTAALAGYFLLRRGDLL